MQLNLLSKQFQDIPIIKSNNPKIMERIWYLNMRHKATLYKKLWIHKEDMKVWENKLRVQVVTNHTFKEEDILMLRMEFLEVTHTKHLWQRTMREYQWMIKAWWKNMVEIQLDRTFNKIYLKNCLLTTNNTHNTLITTDHWHVI